MNWRLYGRRVVNSAVRLIPGSLTRLVLKSFWQQPRLQDKLQFHVQPYRFDSAIPTVFDVDRTALRSRRNLPGLPLEPSIYLSWLSKIAPFAGELSDVPNDPSPDAGFCFRNGAYGELDAVTLYCMVRHLKPKRLIEVGSGYSSKVTARAVAKNASEGQPCACTFIEPFPPAYFLSDQPPGEFIQKKVQDVPLDVFRTLEAGDILFIDTSHVLKTQGDCCYELLEIIPSLAPGVIVHVHDVFTPYDYPEEWLFERQFPFNEQYALECLLTGNSNFEVILPVFLLWEEHREQMREMLSTARDNPGAFWFRIRDRI